MNITRPYPNLLLSRSEIHVEACILLDFHEFFISWFFYFHSIFLKIGKWFNHILKKYNFLFFLFQLFKWPMYTTLFWEGRSETSPSADILASVLLIWK